MKRWLYEPFPSFQWKDPGVKCYGMAFFSYREKIQKYTVQYMEGVFGNIFTFLENLNTVNSFETLGLGKNYNEGLVILDKI